MTEPLNPLLYRRLKKVFGTVRISNEGQPIKFRYRPDWQYRNGRLRAEVASAGETYYVNCPFCSDNWQRLGISYHWSVEDEKTHDDMLHLANCFNEECIASRDDQKKLHAIVYPRGQYGRTMKVRLPPKPAAERPIPVRIVLPAGTPLSELPADHPAIKYLRRRKFDPAQLAKRWAVYYCEANRERLGQEHKTRPYFYSKRIVYPVCVPLALALDDGNQAKQRVRLAGWQARALEDEPSDRAPKYLTSYGMKKSELLYGLPKAIKSGGPIIVVEGVTDVWRLGTNAVGLFGKTVSKSQIKLLLRHLAGRPIVVLLDQDATQCACKVRDTIRNGRLVAGEDAQVVIGKLPRGRKDPGECTHAEVWNAVRKALKERS